MFNAQNFPLMRFRKYFVYKIPQSMFDVKDMQQNRMTFLGKIGRIGTE